MSSLDTPLNDQELDSLDAFLLARIPDEAVATLGEGEHEGILNISELDGFLTAIISGPEAIRPGEWLPVVWGAFEPQWASPDESETTLSLLLRHMNGIINTLLADPEHFEPIVLEREEGGELVTVVDDWCLGYMKGVALAREAWQRGGEVLMEMMFPILLFSSEKMRERLAEIEPGEVAALKRSIAATAYRLHSFWMQRRGNGGARQPFVHDGPQVGRNDPCPCGSGKKFKKCCLH